MTAQTSTIEPFEGFEPQPKLTGFVRHDSGRAGCVIDLRGLNS